MDHDSIDSKLLCIAQNAQQSAREASSMVGFLLRQFNAHEPLPATVNIGGRLIDTTGFLRGITFNPATRNLPNVNGFQRGLGQNANDLAGQANDLADAAEREGLLQPAPAASATPSLHPFDTRRDLDRDSVARLRAAGISASYVKPPEPEFYVPPRPSRVPVEREFDPNGEAFARTNTAEAVAARRAADPATLARQSAEAASAEADRARLNEVHRIRADKARGGHFDRSAFRDQTSGETAIRATASAVSLFSTIFGKGRFSPPYRPAPASFPY